MQLARFNFSARSLGSVLALLLAACGSEGSDPDPFMPGDSPFGVPSDTADPQESTPSAPGTGDAPTDVGQPQAPGGTGDTPTQDLPLDSSGETPATGETPAPPGEGEQPPPAEEQPPPGEEPVTVFLERPTRGTRNLFTELLGIPESEVNQKVITAVERVFGIGTNEPTNPPAADSGFRLYYELPQDPNRAFIWAVDSNDIRSEGMSYGMMIAVQMDMQREFDRLWNFSRTHMQFPANSNITAWRYYFRWQGQVNTSNPNNWQVNYGAETGPAPDGEEYFAMALFLAHRRWGSGGAINYLQEAQNLSRAMLNNPSAGGRTPVFNGGSNMVVFFPQGNSANFSDPSYHLPAFYELFATDGPQQDAARWRQIANVSRQYFVSSAHPTTGLHPDYANFDGSPNTGGSNHDQFRYDAWRVVMNMAIDYAWTGPDQRLQTQIEKYHSFFNQYLGDDNVTAALFNLNGSGASGGSSTALTATLASGALGSNAANRTRYVENLWRVGQQSGLYRYYQETVYLLALLATAGVYGYEWDPAASPQ